MNAKRTLTFVVISAALIAWFAGAATSNREIASPPIVARAPIDASGQDLAKEIARLHERLRPDATPRLPGRNLFTFQSAVRTARQPMVPAPVPALGPREGARVRSWPLTPSNATAIGLRSSSRSGAATHANWHEQPWTAASGS